MCVSSFWICDLARDEFKSSTKALSCRALIIYWILQLLVLTFFALASFAPTEKIKIKKKIEDRERRKNLFFVFFYQATHNLPALMMMINHQNVEIQFFKNKIYMIIRQLKTMSFYVFVVCCLLCFVRSHFINKSHAEEFTIHTNLPFLRIIMLVHTIF